MNPTLAGLRRLTLAVPITPDIQYVIRPSGMQSIDNALLAGVLLYLTF